MNDDLAFLPEADDQKLLAQVMGYYQRSFQRSAEAQGYLSKRGITNNQAVERFGIGYADRSLGLTLPTKHTKAGREIRARLEALGLFRESGHEHFNGSVVFPIHAGDGTRRIVDVYGRKIQRGLRKGTPLHTFLAKERSGVWNVDAFGATDEIILCPSLFDALTFWSNGYRNVTCMFGPDALTADHLAAFKEFRIKRVLTPCAAICPKVIDAGMDCFQLGIPAGLDINALACRAEKPSDVLGAVLRAATWVGQGKPVATASVQKASNETADANVGPDAPPATPAPVAEPTPPAVVPQSEPAATIESPVPPVQAASPLPPAPEVIEAEVKEDEVAMTFGNRRYRVRGWTKNLSFDQLRVNVMVATERMMFVDTFDLYAARHRRGFVTQAAAEFGVEEQVIKKDLGRLLLKLEELQDDFIQKMTQPKEVHPLMSDDERQQAIRFLREPHLLDRIVADFQVVGESTNKLVGYLAAVSRKLDQPLAIIIQSSSAAGKTALMEAVLAFVPPEDQVKYSAMTGQSLYYMGDGSLKHKVLAIVEEEGAERASYALKLLQSEGELMIASTGKDESGRLTTQEYRVEGPVMIFLTTTAIKIDEELLNRCLVLTVDEDREQTRAIHKLQRQRQTLQGLLAAQRQEKTLTLHRNAQRLLKPLLVANPYAEALTFLDDKTRTRRDHVKYLTLIRAITLLHQYQRPIKVVDHENHPVEYIEVTLEDIDIANRLANEVLGRSVDDLPPQTRRLLGLIDEFVTGQCRQRGMARADVRFSRRDVREATAWGNTQLKVHLKRLEEMEYLLVHRGGRGQSFVYELLYEPRADEGQKFLARLIDVEQLRRNRSGPEAERAGAFRPLSERSRPQAGVMPGESRPTEALSNPENSAAELISESEVSAPTHGA
jgi:DNA primase